MTAQERQEMFAKEYLSIADIQKLYGINYPTASKFICDIKRKLTVGKGQELRLDMQGKIHIQDYLDYLGVNENRYGFGFYPTKNKDDNGGQEEWQSVV
jgi:hypothetical protein